MIKICKWCKKDFKTRPDRGTFCSVKCRTENNKKQIKIVCKVCKKEFFSILTNHRTLCSQKCTGIFNRERYKFGNVWNWKGDKVGYRTLHHWVVKWRGKPKTCEHCGKSNLAGRKIQWANKSKKYLRDLSDWIRLCVKCHKAFDKKI